MQFKVCSKTQKKISSHIFQLKAWIRVVPEGGGVLGLPAWFTDIRQRDWSFVSGEMRETKY